MLHRTQQRPLDGYTIIEVIIIVVVIGILAGIVYGAYGVVTRDAFNSRVISDMTAYRNGFELYASQENEYPAVPRSGTYCLGTGGMTGEEINDLGYAGTPLPTSLTAQGTTEISYYCRDLGAVATRHSNYPPLSRELQTIVELKQRGQSGEYLVDPYTGGIYVHYGGADADNVVLRLFGWFKGDECPSETTVSWSSTEYQKSLCFMELEKTFPVNYTGESWPAAG